MLLCEGKNDYSKMSDEDMKTICDMLDTKSETVPEVSEAHETEENAENDE